MPFNRKADMPINIAVFVAAILIGSIICGCACSPVQDSTQDDPLANIPTGLEVVAYENIRNASATNPRIIVYRDTLTDVIYFSAQTSANGNAGLGISPRYNEDGSLMTYQLFCKKTEL